MTRATASAATLVRGRLTTEMHRLVLLIVALALAAPGAGAAALPPVPNGWPRTLEIGLADSPDGARDLRRSAPFGFRYQYLAGGVNTGDGWATWNPNGTFVSMYVRDSHDHGVIPVFTYYMLLQSKPGGGDEAHADLANLRNPDTMRAYWQDVRLFLNRARATKPVVLHVEPDLWGYIQQAARNDDAATVPAVVPVGLPQNAAGFAQEFLRLRDALAPNVILAWHMSVWGTRHDIVYEDPPDETVRAYAARSAAFYRSLHARFDLSFEDYSDRDAGYYEAIHGNSATWFKAADFHRHLLYGATFVGRAHLNAYASAGYVGFLFGGGADGTTCACDAQQDGVTNPAPVNGNTHPSLSADDDGGYFRARVRSYYAGGRIVLP